MTRLWALGAPDPEMERVEALIRDAGERVAYALGPTGRRVTPAEAYEAPATSLPITPGQQLVCVECEPAGVDRPIIIDHHRPGDPGYGRPVAEFWLASSVGQVWRLLGRWDDDVPADLLLCAAADHCLPHAYAGRCPGVHPDELMRWRAADRARFQRRPVAEVEAHIAAAMQALHAAPRTVIARQKVAIMGDRLVPELPEAAARLGIPFTAIVPAPGDGRKLVLQCAPAHVVRAWMEAHPGAYGDPARGFAGVVTSPPTQRP